MQLATFGAARVELFYSCQFRTVNDGPPAKLSYPAKMTTEAPDFNNM